MSIVHCLHRRLASLALLSKAEVLLSEVHSGAIGRISRRAQTDDAINEPPSVLWVLQFRGHLGHHLRIDKPSVPCALHIDARVYHSWTDALLPLTEANTFRDEYKNEEDRFPPSRLFGTGQF